MRKYTVVGLRDRSGALHVAGVFEGKQEPVDNNDTRRFGRWFGYVTAADPDEAEKFATEEATW